MVSLASRSNKARRQRMLKQAHGTLRCYRLLVAGLFVSVALTVWLHGKIMSGGRWSMLHHGGGGGGRIQAPPEKEHPAYWKYLPRRRTAKSSTKQSSSSTNNRQTTASAKDDHEQQKPLNVVLLYADDWRHDSLGVAGNALVQTPFLDSLAQQGVRFSNCAVTTSLCWMSRGTLHTGMYASRHGGWMPDQPYWYHFWYESFPYVLQQLGGYAVAHVGKWDYTFFHDIKEIYETYNYTRLYQYKHWYSRDEVEAEVARQTKATGQPRFDNNDHSYTTNANGEIHATDRALHDAMEFLTHRPPDQPFMMTVAFFPPHSVDNTIEQFYPQPETGPLYQNVTAIRPPVPPDFTVENMNSAWDRLPGSIFQEVGNEARHRWHLRFNETTKYSAMMTNYYRLITGVDAACETIVDELKRQGVADDTLIIFTTDNGFYHGEHGLAGKWFPHQESIRVPLIIVDPRAPSSTAGTVVDEFTLNIDLAPTLLRAARVPIPGGMQGRDISELYLPPQKQQPHAWRDEFYYEHPQFWDEVFLPASTALVRKSHKYIQWGAAESVVNRVEQLFDLIQDPNEEEDVSKRPEYQSVLREMRLRHDELRLECCSDESTSK